MLQRVGRPRPIHELVLSVELDPLSGIVAPDTAHVESLTEVVLVVYFGILPDLLEPMLDVLVKLLMLLVASGVELTDEGDDIVRFVGDEPLVLEPGLGEVTGSCGLPLAG